MVSNTLLENVYNPTQFMVLQDLFRLITSEWLCVNMYIERDLNTIEWRVEDNKTPVSFQGFQLFLSSLFRLRRRINKYSTLVEEQLRICKIQKPASWITSACMAMPSSSNTRTNDVFVGIQKDLTQVQEAIQKNRDRIAQSVGLIMSLISELEAKQSVAQNRRLAFLTLLATLLLPFNTIAAILDMDTEYGVGKPKFGTFFRISGGVVGLAILMLVLLYTWPVLLERRRRHDIM